MNKKTCYTFALSKGTKQSNNAYVGSLNSNMKIKVSQPMLRIIKEVCKDLECVANVTMCKASYNSYLMNALPIGFHGDWVMEDMDKCSDGKYKYIHIEYTNDCYACPFNITSASLIYEFRRNNVSNFEEFKKMLKEMIEM